MRSKSGQILGGLLALVMGIGVAGTLFLYMNPHRFVSYNPFTKPEMIVDYSVIEAWDLVVYGTEPEGIAAAVAGARQNLKTLLISEDSTYGGLMTLGWLNSLDMSFDISGPERLLLTQGIFEEWWDEIHRPFSFQISEASRAFLRMMAAEANLTVRTNQSLLGIERHDIQAVPDAEHGRYPLLQTGESSPSGREVLHRLKFANPEGLEYRVEAPFYIDATADAELLAQTGAEFSIGWEDIGRPDTWMAPTIVFEVEGVNWNEVVAYAQGLGDMRYGANADSAWAYWEIVENYQPEDPLTYLRGLNIGRQNRDDNQREYTTVLINALLLFDVDVFSPEAKQQALLRGEAEARRIVEFLQDEAPGFGNAVFSRSAPQLYVRESRHLHSLYTLSIDDVLEERHFWDEIAIGAYPVDLQAVSAGERERTLYAPIRGYGIPLRCLIPSKGPSNAFVVGRSAGFSSEAHGSARVIPVGMVCGEAAALAVSYALAEKLADTHQLVSNEAVASIQQEIRARGGFLRFEEARSE